MLLRILGHAIGIWNEEMRSDRDSYIRILTDNVLEDSLEFFLINADDTHGIPYDYCSIMHSHERVWTLDYDSRYFCYKEFSKFYC